MYGHDMWYIPRKLNNLDEVYGEDDQSSYEQAFEIEMYIKNVNGFMGDGDFISRMAGLEVKPQILITVARRTFGDEVLAHTGGLRPNEGDLIWFTMNERMFQVKYVNKYEIFYQTGTLLTWELTCELFQYSGETFSTGIPEIDAIQTGSSTNVLDWTLATEDGYYLTDELGRFIILEGTPVTDTPLDNTDQIQQESDEFIDFTQVDPFSEGHI